MASEIQGIRDLDGTSSPWARFQGIRDLEGTSPSWARVSPQETEYEKLKNTPIWIYANQNPGAYGS